MSTVSKVDLIQQAETYPFLKTFLYDPEDPIKQKWEMIQDWSTQCVKNPEITEKQFKVLRQRYELTPLYEDESLTENNSFLQDVFSRISDPDKYDKTNQNTLTEAQFEAVKRIMNQNIATNTFLSKVPELMNNAKDKIDKLPFKKFDYTRFEQSVSAWGKYRFLSYGHPKMIELYHKMIENGGDLNSDEIKDVVYYMKQKGSYTYGNKDFKEALKWFSKMNWVNEHKYGDDIYQMHIKDYFDIIYRRYTNIKSVIIDEETLKRCEYMQKEKWKEAELYIPDVKDIESWLQNLSKKESDPLIIFLREKVSDYTLFDDVQNAIVNRFQLDIGGLLDKHSDVLMALLQNIHLYNINPDEIENERQKVLSGAKLTPEYLEELKNLIENVQQQLRKKAFE
eukprot:95884_1